MIFAGSIDTIEMMHIIRVNYYMRTTFKRQGPHKPGQWIFPRMVWISLEKYSGYFFFILLGCYITVNLLFLPRSHLLSCYITVLLMSPRNVQPQLMSNWIPFKKLREIFKVLSNYSTKITTYYTKSRIEITGTIIRR